MCEGDMRHTLELAAHMPLHASERPVHPAIARRIEAEMAEIRDIYDLLYGDCALTLLLFQGDSPVWSAPEVVEGQAAIGWHHLRGDYLGCVVRPAPHPGAREVTVALSIPRAPTAGEIADGEAPWTPLRRLKPVFALKPMAYEQIRYQAEMVRGRLATKRHNHDSLPRGRGSTLLPPPAPPVQANRPAVLIGFHWLEVGGAEKLAFDSVRWALEAGLRVFVVASVASIQRLADRLPDHPDVRFIRLDRYLPHRLWPRYVQRLVQAQNVRLIHIHHCQPLYDSLPQLRLFAPWVEVIDSTHIVEYANGGYPRISGVWTNFIDTHHVISGELVDYYRSQFDAQHNVRLGRMIERHDAGVTLPPLNMQPGQKTLHAAFVGRLYYQKRPVVLVEILRALARWAARRGVEFRATLVGEGPFGNALRQLVQRYGLSDRVEMQAAGVDVPALLSRADILLLPSNNEGLALVCYEAIEHGCIPISTDVGSQDEIVPPELLVPLNPRKTVRETVRAVDRLWSDAGFLARQERAMQDAWARISADPTAREVLMPIYRKAARGGEDS